jgi:hypothetical protein
MNQQRVGFDLSGVPPRQPAKVTPFAGVTELMFRKSAAGDFFQ